MYLHRSSRVADARPECLASAVSENRRKPMSRRRSKRLVAGRRWLADARSRWAAGLRRAWQAICRWRRPVPVEVLIVDRTRRRMLEQELLRGLHRLQRVLGAPLPAGLAIVIQQVIATDRQLAGCYQVGQRPDGNRFALVRLALQVNGRRLTTDELLSALAEQYVGLAMRESAGALVPIDLEPGPPAESRRLTALRPDPLAPHSNSAACGERVA
jgi:hypothetical protein